MLILSRKEGEQVFINNGSIQVKILRVDGNNINIGFIAPADVDIDREEVFQQKQLRKNKPQHVAA